MQYVELNEFLFDFHRLLDVWPKVRSPAMNIGSVTLRVMYQGCFLPFSVTILSVPSRRSALPPISPLRTVRESFHLTRLKPQLTPMSVGAVCTG